MISLYEALLVLSISISSKFQKIVHITLWCSRKVTVNGMQGVNNAAKREKQQSLNEVTTASVYVRFPHNIPKSLSVIQITKNRFQIR